MILSRILLLALFLVVALPQAQAETSLASLPEVKAAESYLRGVTTLKARFLQTAHDGSQVAGTFLLKRPGKMRFEYDPPVKDFIVSDGLFVYYYDSALQEQSSMPVSSSLADFFLREDISLSGDIRVENVQRGGGLLQITLVQDKDPLAGSLTLGLAEKPMALRKWRVVDAQGLTTEVELFETAAGITLKDDMFHYYDPTRKDPAYNK